MTRFMYAGCEWEATFIEEDETWYFSAAVFISLDDPEALLMHFKDDDRLVDAAYAALADEDDAIAHAKADEARKEV